MRVTILFDILMCNRVRKHCADDVVYAMPSINAVIPNYLALNRRNENSALYFISSAT